MKIAIAGAGSIGCYAGACLADAGRVVTLFLRPARAAHIGASGIRVSDLDSRNRLITPDKFKIATDAKTAFADADLILVCVKRGATEEIGRDIARHAHDAAIVLSLQNGIGAEDELAPLILPRIALPGVVMFNAVLDDTDRGKPLVAHRATEGGLYMPEGHETVRAALDVPGLSCASRADMRAVAWGKLLLNLNNALNALSGLPLRGQLEQRAWRRLLGEQVREALVVLTAAGVHPAQVGAVKPAMIPKVLNLPDWLFKIAAARLLAIDPRARSSMWEDLDRRRTTEIDLLQGAILKLARQYGVAAPLTERLHGLIKVAEAAALGSPRMAASAVRGG